MQGRGFFVVYSKREGADSVVSVFVFVFVFVLFRESGNRRPVDGVRRRGRSCMGAIIYVLHLHVRKRLHQRAPKCAHTHAHTPTVVCMRALRTLWKSVHRWIGLEFSGKKRAKFLCLARSGRC